MGPLWVLALGCDGEPTKPGPTDTGDDPSTDTETAGDTGAEPTEPEYFQPAYVYATAFFGWDAETSTAGSYLYANGATVVPQILLTVYSTGFLLDGDFVAGSCGVVLTYDTANGPLAPEPWTFTRGATVHDHVGLRFPAGSFTAADLADANRGSYGCSNQRFDPERFPDGLFAALLERDWGFGFGTIDAGLVDQVASDPAYDATHALLDSGHLVGGSFLGTGDPPYDARWFVRGNPLGGDGRVQLDVPLTADQMYPAGAPATDTAADTASPPSAVPATGGYVVFPPNWVPAAALLPRPTAR